MKVNPHELRIALKDFYSVMCFVVKKKIDRLENENEKRIQNPYPNNIRNRIRFGKNL